MSVTRVASRYAKSLLDLAKEQNKLDKVLEDIQSFKKAIANRDLYLLVKSPIVNTTKKETIFKELFHGKYDELTMAFFDIILRKGRESYLPAIVSEYEKQYKALKGITEVSITTATELSDAELQKIREKLLASEITAQELEFTTKVDPDIIGGFVIKIEDNLYDASVARKLNDLRKEFSSNKYVKEF